MARFQVLAVNDKRDFCECCGKQGLKRVVWILDTETGYEKHFGTSCAAKPAKGFDVNVEIKAAVKAREVFEKSCLIRAAKAYKAAGGTLTNGRDKNGSAIATRDDKELWSKLYAAELAKA
jgi:hypothetical protein